jgi:3-dehydroquinate synthetase
MVQTNQDMPSHVVTTGTQRYECHIERGILSRIGEFLPAKAGKVFVVTTRDVWQLHGAHLTFPHEVIFFPGGEPNKRLPVVEAMAEEMVAKGRTDRRWWWRSGAALWETRADSWRRCSCAGSR